MNVENVAEPVGRRVLLMSMEREVCKDLTTQRKLDMMQMADWVNYLAPWQVIAHLTFKDRIGFYRDGTERPIGMGLDPARRAYEKFMSKEFPRLSYFYAIEPNPSREGHHVHALWSDAATLYRKEAWCAWFNRYGRARIEPVRNFGDVSDYCSKYCTKDAAWWDVKLQWHRIQAMHNRPYELIGLPAPAATLRSSSPEPGGFAAVPVRVDELPPAALGNTVANLGTHAPTMSPAGSGGQRHHTPGEPCFVDQAVWQNAGPGIWNQVDP